MFSFAFYAISNIYNFTIEKRLFSFHFAFYAIFNITKQIGNIEKFPFTYWLNTEVVSPNSR